MKVAGAAAAAAAFVGGLCILLKEPEQVALEARGGSHTKEAQAQAVWTKPKVGWVQLNVDGPHSLLKQPEPEPVQVVVHYQGKEAQAQLVWTKPKVGWVKLNVDGTLLRESQSAGCGGVLRDASGEWLYGFAQKLNPSSTVYETEKEGILIGLEWARGKGVRKLVVESDNKGVVRLVNNGRKSNDPLICGMRELLNSPHWEATLTWIPRDANQVADKVAANTHAWRSFDLREFIYPPSNCIPALSKDVQ